MTPRDNARQRIASRPSWSIPADRVRPFQARREQLRRGRQQLERLLERLSDAYLQTLIPLAEYRRRRQDLEQRRGRWRARATSWRLRPNASKLWPA